MEPPGSRSQLLSDALCPNYSVRYQMHEEEMFLGENHLWEVRSRKDEEGASFSPRKRSTLSVLSLTRSSC